MPIPTTNVAVFNVSPPSLFLPTSGTTTVKAWIAFSILLIEFWWFENQGKSKANNDATIQPSNSSGSTPQKQTDDSFELRPRPARQLLRPFLYAHSYAQFLSSTPFKNVEICIS